MLPHPLTRNSVVLGLHSCNLTVEPSLPPQGVPAEVVCGPAEDCGVALALAGALALQRTILALSGVGGLLRSVSAADASPTVCHEAADEGLTSGAGGSHLSGGHACAYDPRHPALGLGISTQARPPCDSNPASCFWDLRYRQPRSV